MSLCTHTFVITSGMQSHAHTSIFAIFSLVLDTFILITGLFRCAIMAGVTVAKSKKISKISLHFFSECKIKFFDFYVFAIVMYALHLTSQVGHFRNLFWDCCSLQNNSFFSWSSTSTWILKQMLLPIASHKSGRGLCLRFILKLHFIKISNS